MDYIFFDGCESRAWFAHCSIALIWSHSAFLPIVSLIFSCVTIASAVGEEQRPPGDALGRVDAQSEARHAAAADGSDIANRITAPAASTQELCTQTTQAGTAQGIEARRADTEQLPPLAQAAHSSLLPEVRTEALVAANIEDMDLLCLPFTELFISRSRYRLSSTSTL